MSRKATPASSHSRLIGWAIIVGLTLISLVAIRFVWAQNPASPPHYHADFAIYINGVALDFDSPSYYEEVTACSEEERNRPQSRAHLHAPNPGVVHVHDYAVSWSHFLANLGIVLADDYLGASANSYLPDEQNQLRFILNGQFVSYPTSRVIGNEDILLIDYGSDPNEEVRARYNQIKPQAAMANQTNDPYGCFGTSEVMSIGQRLWQALQIWR